MTQTVLCPRPTEFTFVGATKDLFSDTGASAKMVATVASLASNIADLFEVSSSEASTIARLSAEASSITALPGAIGSLCETWMAGEKLLEKASWKQGAKLTTSFTGLIAKSFEWILAIAKAGVVALSDAQVYLFKVVRYSANVIGDLVKGAQTIGEYRSSDSATTFGSQWWAVAKEISALAFHGVSLAATALSLVVNPFFTLMLGSVYTTTFVASHYVGSREKADSAIEVWEANHNRG
jgi:hypothetical protein